MSEVYFSSLSATKFNSPLNKLERLFKACNKDNQFQAGEIIAVKVHFGELGNTAFIRPIYLRPVIKVLKEIGVKPFLTDTNTLYPGMRGNSVDHLHNAALNGFNYSTLGTPVIIADGLRGENFINVSVGLKMLDSVMIASEIANSDGLVAVSHFKGHELGGFGGAIKNISMGAACRRGKLQMHSNTKPVVTKEECTECGMCADNCQSRAIDLTPVAFITERCVGCVRCIAVCPVKAIKNNWDESADNVQKKMAEYACGTMKAVRNKAVFINILTSISPGCDCYPGNDKPLTGDIGFLASLDPVALDRASYEMVINSMPDKSDPFKATYNYLDPAVQLHHAQLCGLGSNDI